MFLEGMVWAMLNQLDNMFLVYTIWVPMSFESMNTQLGKGSKLVPQELNCIYQVGSPKYTKTPWGNTPLVGMEIQIYRLLDLGKKYHQDISLEYISFIFAVIHINSYISCMTKTSSNIVIRLWYCCALGTIV